MVRFFLLIIVLKYLNPALSEGEGAGVVMDRNLTPSLFEGEGAEVGISLCSSYYFEELRGMTQCNIN